MLEKLDYVNWNDFHSGSSDFNTEGLSELLRNIVSATDDDTYIECLDTLSSKIIHQNLVFEVTAHVVPFLIEILAAHISPQNKDILHILAVIAGGPDLNNDGSNYERWARNAHDEVDKGLEIYLQYLNSTDPHVIRNVVWLLGNLKRQSQKIIPLLLQVLNLVEDSVLKAMLLKTIWSLYQVTPNQSVEITNGVVQALNQIVGQDKRDLVEVTASSIIIRIQGDRAPQRAIDNVAATLESPSIYMRENWQHPPLLNDLCETLFSIGVEKRFEILESAIEKSDNINDIFVLCFALVDSAFGTTYLRQYTTTYSSYSNMHKETVVRFIPVTRYVEPPLDCSTLRLDTDVKKILRVIWENDHIWDVKTNFFEIVGLPSTRAGLQNMILQH